ncbi:PLB2 [Candida oxycetoniae]|uniref:Lysophospholipase n=1 Tax=Candida oxycetoniae TaxID=497107 RepID=A0AAI9STF4_9ASCO|nr:PLB2 [Candida oxycetoniae]KAI3402476.2 PLB2 [Candida oxycetoniae]
MLTNWPSLVFSGFWSSLSSPAGYAPIEVDCPAGSLVRNSSTGLNSNEATYIQSRYTIAKQNLGQYLKSSNLHDFDVDAFLSVANPTIGVAFSGGGYRAQLVGAGEYAALDSRTNLINGNSLGGVLQSSNYISGLSGGAWLVGSLVSNNLVTIDQILSQDILWNTVNSILDYYDNLVEELEMWIEIALQVESKQLNGFTISITDFWGRALSYQLLPFFPQEAAGFPFSNVVQLPVFQNYYSPFPILVADGREPNTTIVNSNSTVFELTPYEIGSRDPSLGSFVQTKYLGTELDNGVPSSSSSSSSSRCINGFDNTGFFIGTSSSLFNDILLTIDQDYIPEFLQKIIEEILVDPFEKLNVDVAHYNPNPFYKSTNPDTPIAESKTLYLADGGEDGQNVPLLPLLHRNLSVVFAFDNSADELNWPDGTALIQTYERQFSEQGKGIAFPYVPGQSSFLNLNLTAKPTFFGCDAKNLSTLTDDIYDVPLVIYIANRPFTFWSNTSTFKLEYSVQERNRMIQNGFEVASRLNGTLDDEWEACVGCAIIRREQERMNLTQTDQCKQCFEKYCWDGTIYDGPSIGDNFDDEGRTVGAGPYNSCDIPGASKVHKSE